jgi:flagellar motility protein MotE (MotC chaperone)
MRGKLRIFLLATLALLSFALFFWLVLWSRGAVTSDGWVKPADSSKTEQAKAPAAQDKVPDENSGKNFMFPLPPPFSFEEIAQLMQSLKEKQQEYDSKLKALEAEREQLARVKNVLEERKQEVLVLMEKVSSLLGELDDKKRGKEQQQAAQKVSEEQNLKKLAKLFAGMDVDQATERLGQMEATTCARILSLMAPRSASKILSQMDPDKVKTLTQLMQQGTEK